MRKTNDSPQYKLWARGYDSTHRIIIRLDKITITEVSFWTPVPDLNSLRQLHVMRVLPSRCAKYSIVALTFVLGCSGSSSSVAVATGASAAVGGQSDTGGGSQGGTPSGGAESAGQPSTGGAGGVQSNTGGSLATALTGGASATGGVRALGGSRNVGGSKATGGAGSPGGTSATGGSSAATAGAGCTGGPLTTSIPKCVIVPPATTGDYHQDCVNTINKIRWDCMCLPPLQRWTEGEACADQMANYDATQNSAHAGFIARLCTPGGTAENECPGWGSVSSITQGTTRMESCMAMMWHEVDTPTGEQGHYVAMSSSTYTRVACGINSSTTNVWALQNYSR